MPKPRRPISISDITVSVLATPKYSAVASSFIDAIGKSEAPKSGSQEEAAKRVKRKLHQTVGAYLNGKIATDRWLADLVSASTSQARAETVQRILRQHASSRERSESLSPFYEAIFAGLGEVKTVVDLACGLNPLARPFMPLPPDCAYGVYDVHGALVDFVLRALDLLGYPAFGSTWDLLNGPPEVEADVVLLLKTLPCLTQVDQAVGVRLLLAIKAPTIVVSYPVRSLGGGKRGMRGFYRNQFLSLARALPRRIEELPIAEELVFRLRDP